MKDCCKQELSRQKKEFVGVLEKMRVNEVPNDNLVIKWVEDFNNSIDQAINNLTDGEEEIDEER